MMSPRLCRFNKVHGDFEFDGILKVETSKEAVFALAS